MDVTHAIAEAVAHFDSPPPNEAATCLWVVYPLLLELGYARKEIRPQGSDSNGQFPDYTILPDSPHAWYLEAKAWNVALQDGHAHQALNYANQNGKRWVVLSNGRVWRLYDNQIQGVAVDKVVAEAKLEDVEGAEHFLAALSKEAVTSGALGRFAVRSRLSSVLHGQLTDPDSRVVKDLWRYLKGQPGLLSVSCAEIVSYFAGPPLLSAPAPIARPAPDRPLPTPQPAVDTVGLSLDFLAVNAAEYITGKKPRMLTLPDHSQKQVSNWREMALEVVDWLGRHNRLPELPFRGQPGGNRYFLNSTPNHEAEPMRPGYKQLRFGERLAYLDAHRSAEDLVSRVYATCEAAGEPAERFIISLAE